MDDLERCSTLARIACEEDVSTAILYAEDIGISRDEAIFDLEFMGVLR